MEQGSEMIIVIAREKADRERKIEQCTGLKNRLVFDCEALLLLQCVNHGGEEQLILNQFGQDLAALIELNLHCILIPDQTTTEKSPTVCIVVAYSLEAELVSHLT